MNRITPMQFGSMLLIGDVFALFCMSGTVSVVTAAGFGIGIIMQMLLAMICVMIYRKVKLRVWLQKVISGVLLAWVIFWGGSLFSMMLRTSGIIYIPHGSSGIWERIAVTALIALVCAYISSRGIRALARSAVIAAAVGAVCIVVVTVSALVQSDMANLCRETELTLGSEFVRGLTVSGGIGSLAVLLVHTEGDELKAAVGYYLARLGVTAVILTVSVLVCGGIMDIAEYPVAFAAQLSQPFAVQRIDSLFLAVYSVFVIYAIGVQTAVGDMLITKLMPKFRRYRCAVILLLMIGAGVLLKY